MNIQKIVREKNDNYTIVCNLILRDKRVSCKARGFFTTVMSLPDDWDFSVSGMEAILKEGRDAVYSMIEELETTGYCRKGPVRGPMGEFRGYAYIFSETPIGPDPGSDNTNPPFPASPDTAPPDTGNPTQLNTDYNQVPKESIDPPTEDAPPAAGDVSAVPDPPLEEEVPVKKKRASKAKTPPDPRKEHPAIAALRQATLRYPPKELWDVLIKAIGDEPDADRLLECYQRWRVKGWNPNNYSWVMDWYVPGGADLPAGSPVRQQPTIDREFDPNDTSWRSKVTFHNMIAMQEAGDPAMYRDRALYEASRDQWLARCPDSITEVKEYELSERFRQRFGEDGSRSTGGGPAAGGSAQHGAAVDTLSVP